MVAMLFPWLAVITLMNACEQWQPFSVAFVIFHSEVVNWKPMACPSPSVAPRVQVMVVGCCMVCLKVARCNVFCD